MSSKCTRSRCISLYRVLLLILVAALPAARPNVGRAEPARDFVGPRAPDILELVQVGGSEAEGSVTLEAIIHPVVDGEVELEVLSPTTLRFASRARSQRFQLQRGGPIQREHIQLELSGQEPTTVRVRARLLDADGQPWLIVDRELRFNQPSPDVSRLRVPIVRTSPDGSRRVEYMERGLAESRGLLRQPADAPATEQSLPATTAAQIGGDPVGARHNQE